MWSSCTGALVAYFACDSTVRHVACTPQGAVALGTHSGLVHFLRLPAPEAGAVGAETDDEGVCSHRLSPLRSQQSARGAFVPWACRKPDAVAVPADEPVPHVVEAVGSSDDELP